MPHEKDGVNTEEHWKDILGYEGCYQVSNQGRVKSLSRLVRFRPDRALALLPERIMSLINNRGYKMVSLVNREKEVRSVAVHRIMWTAFFGVIPHLMEINHKNGIKGDNRLENLEVVTHQQNMQHAASTGLLQYYGGENNPNAKLTKADVMAIKQEWQDSKIGSVVPGRTRKNAPPGFRKMLAAKYGVSVDTIKRAIKGFNW